MFRLLASLLLASLLVTSEHLSAQVVLSEIMFDALGSEFHDEFIEIVNLSQSQSVDLTGWQIDDGTGIDNIVENETGLILQPKQFAIILDRSYFDNSNTYDELIPETSLIVTIDNSTFGSGGLSNSTAETVALINSSGEVVSEYTYSLGNMPGFSDEKIDLFGPNSSDNWLDSKVQLGTPGGPNSVSPLDFDLEIVSAGIIFSPEVVQAGGSVLITSVVRNVGQNPASNFKVVYFEDSDGDSLAEEGEELALPFDFNDGVLPSDSATFSLDYTNLMAGSHLIIVRVEYEKDENTSNNEATKELSVGFLKNTLRINEILYSPLSDQPEWIEIINLSTEPVNINNWSISDSDANFRALVQEEKVVQPDGYFVFSEDSLILEVFNPPPASFIALKNWPSLNNDFDSVVLFDLIGTEIDRVNYRESWGGDRGISLEKINPELASNDSSNWSSSVAFQGGTPGEQNSIFVQSLPKETTISIEPNPFSPDGDGDEDFALISYNLPLTTAVVNIKIYDLRGRLIRFLANNRPVGSLNSIVWDGKNNEGQLARMGIYIIFLQALNAEAGVLETEKKSVVLAGKL